MTLPSTVKRVVMLNPSIREGPCGVYDFTTLMADRMRHLLGWEVEVVPLAVRRASLQGAFQFVIGMDRVDRLDSVLEEVYTALGGFQWIIVQCSGYAMSPDGAPAWLPRGLARFREKHPAAGVITYFHELYAKTPPWRRGFWYTRRQRSFVRGLVRASDYCLTNCYLHEYRLRHEFEVPESRLTVLAVPATIGEPTPETLLPFAARGAVAIVFGSVGLRRAAFAAAQGHWPSILRGLQIDRIIEIGSGVSQAPLEIRGQVDFLGLLDAEAVSRHLSVAKFGLIDYAWPSLGKSTVLSAYQAHGLVTLNLRQSRGEHEVRTAEYNAVLSMSQALEAGINELAAVSGQALNDYSLHSSAALALAVESAVSAHP